MPRRNPIDYRATRRNDARTAGKVYRRKFRDEWRIAPRAIVPVSHRPAQPHGKVYRNKGKQEAARRLRRMSAA